MFRGNGQLTRIDGEIGARFAGALGALCRQPATVTDLLAEHHDLDRDEVEQVLEALVNERVLAHVGETDPVPGNAPLLAYARFIGLDPSHVVRALSRLRVGLIGLGGAGGHAALELGRLGCGGLVLADPRPLVVEDLGLVPLAGQADVGSPRDRILASKLPAGPGPTPVPIPDGFGTAAIERIAADCDVVVASIDDGAPGLHERINDACLEAGTAVLFADLHAHEAVLGPLVVPRTPGCLRCYRTARLACEPNLSVAIAFERRESGEPTAPAARRCLLPPVAAWVAGLIATEILKLAMMPAHLSLVGHTLVLDPLTLGQRRHPFTEQPDCPHCSDPDRAVDEAPQPGTGDLTLGDPDSTNPISNDPASRDPAPGDPALARALDRLLDPRSGLVTDCQPLAKDAGDPTRPYVYQATLSNFRLTDPPLHALMHCAGKGETPEAARLGAVGEAVERYSASVRLPGAVVRAARHELDQASLDPESLVLHAPWQYPDLPFSPYEAVARIGWVEARALVADRALMVPALAAYLDYRPREPAENLFAPTSNGLATGSSIAQATLAGALEVIERDAFLCTWLNRLRCERLEPSTHPDAFVREHHALLARRGVTLHLSRLPTDAPVAVCCALARSTSPDDPATVIGLGAALDVATAARRAVLEVGQLRPALRRRLHRAGAWARVERLVRDPESITHPLDHALVYASPRMSGAADLLAGDGEGDSPWPAPEALDPARGLERLLHHACRTGGEIVSVDLTPPDIARLGLATVRVILPHYQPMHFGPRLRRLGGDRLLDTPRRLGLGEPTAVRDLNPAAHPLS